MRGLRRVRRRGAGRGAARTSTTAAPPARRSAPTGRGWRSRSRRRRPRSRSGSRQRRSAARAATRCAGAGGREPRRRDAARTTRARSAAPRRRSTRRASASVQIVRATTVQFSCSSSRVDDITYSPVAQPDTEILPAALAPTARFLRRQPARHALRLLAGRRGVVAVPSAVHACRGSPRGRTRSRSRMRDRFGTPDATPAVCTWTWPSPPLPPPGRPPGRGRRRRAGREATTAPPASTRPGRRRRRRRRRRVRDGAVGRPDAGDRRAGRSSRSLSGEVFIKLPRVAVAQAGARPGFVPLKGQAALPVGTVVDARKGTPGDGVHGRRPPDRRRREHPVGAGRAGIFQIRQQRPRWARRRGSRPTSCSRARPAPRRVRAHRRLRPDQGPRPQHGARPDGGDGKGLFRIVGAAGISTATDATWATRTAATARAPTSARAA